MGLDSVELIVSIENYFNIHISDNEALKIRSVQDMVDCVAKHLDIVESTNVLKVNLFEKLKPILIQLKFVENSFSYSDKIFLIISPDDKESWTEITKRINLQVPPPYKSTENIINKVFSKVWRPKYDWKTLTVDQFLTAICAENYEKFVDPKSIKNTYEILIAIIAITKDRIGVDIYEIQPDKRFVDDFGID